MSLLTGQVDYLSAGRAHSVTDFTFVAQVYVSLIENNYSLFYGINGSLNSSLGLGPSGNKFTLADNIVDLEGSTVVSAGNWYSVVWVRSGGVDTLEVDGVNQGVGSVGNSTPATNVYLGRFGSGGFNVGLTYVDGVKIYDAALSLEEREAERRQIKPKRWANLFAWLPCNFGGVVGSDWTGLGDWTPTGSPIIQTATPSVAWGDSPLFIPQIGVASSTYYASPLMLTAC